jgi:hypothetical protein
LNHRDLPLILFGTRIDNPDQSWLTTSRKL